MEKLISTIRMEIESIVEAIEPIDSEEKAHREFVKHWIQSGVEIFRIAKPAIPDTHLVSYFLLVDQAANKVLLVDHKKAGLWLPAGGHVEPNEHPKETVKREILEELGMEAEFLLEVPIFLTVTKTVGQTAGHTDVSLWYVLKGDSSKEYLYDKGEFHQIKWFFPSEIPYDRSDPHMLRCIEKLVLLSVLN